MYYYFSNGISSLSRFLSTVILVKYLGPHEYGLLILAMSASGTVSGFIDPRALESVVKFSIESINKGRKTETLHMFYAGHFIGAVVAVATYAFIYFFAPFIAVHLLHQPVEKSLLRMYGILWFFTALTTTPYAIMLVFKEHALLNYLASIESLLKLVIPVLFLSLKIRGVLAGYIIAYATIAILFLWCAGRIVSKHLVLEKISMKDTAQSIKTMFPMMVHTFLSATLKSFIGYSGFLILGYFRTPAEVSYFKIASSYAGMTSFVTNPISPLVFSKLSQLWSEGKKKLFMTALTKGRVYLFLISIGLSFALALLAHIALPLIFGRELAYSITIVYIMLLAFAFSNTYSWMRPFFLAIGRAELSTLLNTIYLCINIPLTILFTFRYGATGTAFSTFISYSVLYVSLSPWFLKQAR